MSQTKTFSRYDIRVFDYDDPISKLKISKGREMLILSFGLKKENVV